MTPTPDYLLIGHITADLTSEGRALGGTVSYAARVAHAFGFPVAALTSAAVDEPLLAELAPYADVTSFPAAVTSTFENVYAPDGLRTQYVRGVANRLTADLLPSAWRAAPLVHLAPLTDEVDPSIAREFPDSTVMLTPQGWFRRWDADGRVGFKRWFDRSILRSVHIVVFSEHDIQDAPELEQQFVSSVEHVIVTKGARGGTYYHHGTPSDYGTPQVETVEPTGAGDVFAASLLSSLQFVEDMDTAIRVAARLGATAVTRSGLQGTPTGAEVMQAIAAAQVQP